MGAELLEDPHCADFFAQCDARLEMPITKLMQEGPEESLDDPKITQPAIFINSYLLFHKHRELLDQNPIKYAFGHSLGEYAALAAAGALDPLEVVSLLKFRGELTSRANSNNDTGMLLVLASYDKFAE